MINIGVVGNGTISGCHFKAYAADPRARLVAVADINRQRAETAAATWGAARFYDDAAALFADPEVDAVSICTPNNTHTDLAMQAIRAGKHVLVEKPMSKSYAEAQELEALVTGQDKMLQVGFVRRHSTNCQVLKQFIDAGELGEIYYAKASCIRRAGNPGGWFANKAVSGGGPLIDIGVHVIDLCWYLMGSPRVATVSANTYNRLGERANITNMSRYRAADAGEASDVEDLANAMIRFDNGASMIMDTSYSLHAVENSLNVSVYGDKGGADLEPLEISTEMHDTVINVTPVLSSNTFVLDDGFGNEISNFIDSCLGVAEPVSPVWHGSEIMKILDAVYASAAEGREIVF